MAGVIEALRWALLGKQHPDFSVIAISTVMFLSFVWRLGLL